jgi:hypothetical protein
MITWQGAEERLLVAFPGTPALNTLHESWLHSSRSLRLAGETTEGKHAVKTLVNRLLSPIHKAMVDVSDDFIVLVLER